MDQPLFTNNATTTLASTLAIAATSATVASGKGALFPSPGTGTHAMLRIGYDNDNEIVKLTARSTDTFTITRAQEGTTAKEWPVSTPIGLYITADSMNKYPALYRTTQTLGTGALDLQAGTTIATWAATGDYAVAMGYTVMASEVDSIAIGKSAGVFYNVSTADYGIAIGSNSFVQDGNASVGIGYTAGCENAEGVALGNNAYTTGHGSIALGTYATSRLKHGMFTTALPFARNDHAGSSSYDNRYPTMESYLFSKVIDLTQTATDNVVNFAIPTGGSFYVTEVGHIIVAATSVTVQPNLSFGNTSNTVALLASTATTANTAKDKEKWTPLLDGGQTEITASLKSSATATALTARIYIKGFMIED